MSKVLSKLFFELLSLCLNLYDKVFLALLLTKERAVRSCFHIAIFKKKFFYFFDTCSLLVCPLGDSILEKKGIYGRKCSLIKKSLSTLLS